MKTTTTIAFLVLFVFYTSTVRGSGSDTCNSPVGAVEPVSKDPGWRFSFNFCGPAEYCGLASACQFRLVSGTNETDEIHILVNSLGEFSVESTTKWVSNYGELCTATGRPRKTVVQWTCGGDTNTIVEDPICTYTATIAVPSSAAICNVDPVVPPFPAPRPSTTSSTLFPVLMASLVCTLFIFLVLYRCRQRALHMQQHPLPPTSTVPPTRTVQHTVAPPTGTVQYVPVYVCTVPPPGMENNGAASAPYATNAPFMVSYVPSGNPGVVYYPLANAPPPQNF
eukprot:TRINITY_DN1250_c0_g1_i1.p1 TRINITY_DN1250_c0_g1~~TRINITY_DN1250_c0_g1_i1.p1  ORF type:complete len:281 (-),score=23.34 TRINITY_DN1250_c0_g1_i1:47-889(-)